MGKKRTLEERASINCSYVSGTDIYSTEGCTASTFIRCEVCQSLFLCEIQVIVCICHLCLLTSICCCIFFFSACNCWLRSSSSSILASISCRISSSSCFLAAKRTLISSASAYSSVSAWSCSWRRFFSSQSYANEMDRKLRLGLQIALQCLFTM